MKLLPHNHEAEQAILGSCFIDNTKAQEILDSVHLTDFYSPRHQEIYKAITHLVDGKLEIDIVTITKHVTKELSEYIYGVIDNTPTAANWSVYAKMLKQLTVRRQLIVEAQGIELSAYDMDNDISETLLQSQKTILSLSLSQGIKLKTAKELQKTILRRIESREGCQGIMSGFGMLDRKIGGLKPGKLYILAARPRMGKTALAKNIAEYVAKKTGAVFIASLEMDAEQLAIRHISGMAQVHGDKFNENTFDSKDYDKLITGLGNYGELPIFYDDAGFQTDLSIMAAARKIKAANGLQLIIVDYLQLIKPSEKSNSREERVASISRNLKAMAKEVNVPVLCLAQLNRECEREKRSPILSDLRESGGIEQDADAIIFIHRDNEYHPEKPAHEADIIVAKNRDGGTGVIPLTWNGPFTNFYNKEDRY